ncbi:MAG: GNAT family N-acetyltransferase [Alphaproteobacteria bacterium]
MTERTSVRLARGADADVLSRHGIPSGRERTVAVAECNGAVAGALSAIARPFESEALGRRTLHIDTVAAWGGDDVLPILAAGALDVLGTGGCQLVTCRRAEGERDVLAALQAGGFRVIECLLTLARPLTEDPTQAGADVALAGEADAEGCAAVGRSAFRYDRFHADPAIDNSAADALKALWARNAVRGRADAVFITKDKGAVTGFNACLRRGDTAVIDLIGVAPGHQGKGLGRALTAAALAHYRGKAARMTVGTQSCNVTSLGLYQSMGFRIEASALTLHAHLP